MHPTAQLASLLWTAPWWAWALPVAAAGPVAAHLLSRAGGRPTAFPATRFVMQVVGDAAQLSRLRRWLLMALRALIGLAAVAAFMQPVWSTATPGVTDQGRTVALVLDRSASMRRAEGGVMLFEQARERALARLRALDPARDRALVVLADADPDALLPKPTANITALTERLRAVEPSDELGRLDAALGLAAQLGQGDASGERRRLMIELYSDAQRTTWPARQALDLPRDASVRLVRVGGWAPNAALHEPRVEPTTPVVGRPARLSVNVANYADETGRFTVTLDWAGRREARVVEVAASAQRRVGFTVEVEEAGEVQAGFAVTPGQALAADDRAMLGVRVIQARPVGVVTDADPTYARTAVYHVLRALQPREDAGFGGVAARVIRPNAFPEPLPDVLVVVEVERLPAAARWRVAEHVRSGGGLIWFTDSEASAEALAALADSPYGLAAPITFGPGPISFKRRSLAGGAFEHPVLRVFDGPERNALLGAGVGRSMAGEASPAADVLLGYDDGSPACAVRWTGEGRFVQFAASVAPGATSLVKRPAFVALLHELVRHVAPVVEAETVRDPGGAFPALESDLHVAEARDVAALESDPDAAPGTPGARDEPGRRREQQPLWPWLVGAALALLVLELGVSGNWRRA